ncbi:LysR family transcriptional regulator [Alloyangia pacifica]|uniref:LysR family transcriptional regulator n=1 Tax=Alloyangia pacifica TaxID=311180 RepID=UPI001CD56E83|nr:LysR family transcriptional regulator [Alloyangia pacifica]MCA0996657.1 LysR family transcriptional regulator [Alloyangia pacifica]
MLHGRALRYIDEVARQGSIRKAARELNVAASAVNRQVLEVEADFGVPIFERLPKGLKLTAPGELLIAHIRETLRDHDRLQARIHALKGQSHGTVTVATMATLAAGRLADVVADYRERHLRVDLKVTVCDRAGLMEMVAAGEAEIGLGYNLPQDNRMQLVAVFQHRLGAVVAPGHPLTAKPNVRVADCLIYPLILASQRLSLRPLIENLAPATADLRPAVETNSTEMMKRLVRQPPNVTFLNRVDVDQELRDGDLAFLPLLAAAGRQRLSLVHRSRGALSPAADGFMQAIHDHFGKGDA